MPDSKPPAAILAADIPFRTRKSILPPELAVRFAGREKRVLGDLFGLRNFGVNVTRLAPGGLSSFRHAHTRQDEFVYVLAGAPTLITNRGETVLAPGMCAGFPAASGDAHQLVNRTDEDVVYLEVGDRTPGDTVDYPEEDLAGAIVDGEWRFTHKDGTPY